MASNQISQEFANCLKLSLLLILFGNCLAEAETTDEKNCHRRFVRNDYEKPTIIIPGYEVNSYPMDVYSFCNKSSIYMKYLETYPNETQLQLTSHEMDRFLLEIFNVTIYYLYNYTAARILVSPQTYPYYIQEFLLNNQFILPANFINLTRCRNVQLDNPDYFNVTVLARLIPDGLADPLSQTSSSRILKGSLKYVKNKSLDDSDYDVLKTIPYPNWSSYGKPFLIKTLKANLLSKDEWNRQFDLYDEERRNCNQISELIEIRNCWAETNIRLQSFCAVQEEKALTVLIDVNHVQYRTGLEYYFTVRKFCRDIKREVLAKTRDQLNLKLY